MRLLVAFGGKMGSGKDTATNYLLDKYSGAHHSFAAPLYDIMKYAQWVCGFEEKKDRALLQFVGTDWARARDPNVWVNIALKDIPEDGNVFLSDIRFSNELTALKEAGWVCVRIDRFSRGRREGTGSSEHSSEKSLDSIEKSRWDFVIENNGSLSEFYSKLDKMISTIKCK